MEDSDVDDEEEDFPEIKVDDLLDEMDNLNIVSIYFAELQSGEPKLTFSSACAG